MTSSYWVLGPFPKLASETNDHQSLAHDYLADLGGDANARIDSATRVKHGQTILESRRVEAEAGLIDFAALWGAGTETPAGDQPATNDKVAYAYAEFESDRAQSGAALFGSDDGAVVWINGERVHTIHANRALTPDDDTFRVPMVAGKNRVLVKVDNGFGGWGFALRLFDEESSARLQAIAARRELDFAPRPVPDKYLLESEFPTFAVGNPALFRHAFGKQALRVRWYGPDLLPATRPESHGRYIALLEATTRDGYSYQRMQTFAKVPGEVTPWLPAPPYREYPVLPLPETLRLTPAEHAELSRLIWAGGVSSLWQGESRAIAASTFFELRQQPPPEDEPSFLHGAFVKNLEHQLKLRMKIEGRVARPLAPPTPLQPAAPELRTGSEAQAGLKVGTVAKLRSIARDWAKSDRHGFVVVVARRGVVVMHEGFNGFKPDSGFYPASIAKSVAGLLFARAVDQKLLNFDAKLSSVFPAWSAEPTRNLTFRHCFYHAAAFGGHFSHGGMYNAYLDQALLVQDGVFLEHGSRYVYGGDDLNLTGMALELTTGQSVFRLLYDHLQRPFAEPVNQFDLGAGASFTGMYLAKLGQMLLQDGAYAGHRFYSPGFVRQLWPEPIAKYAPQFADKELESGIGLAWMIDPPGPRTAGVLGPNVIGHGAASGVLWRVALDHELVVVVGRNGFDNPSANETWGTKFVTAVAEGITKG